LPFVIGDALKALVAGSIALKLKGKWNKKEY
jgi:biotin transporter BioY